MLGISKHVRRSELLHMKSTGTEQEFSDWVQRNILDRGHETEAMARPIAEEVIGEELFPVICTNDNIPGLSASCDGLTMAGDIAWEHKQWNAELAESVCSGVLPEGHKPQCQQILLMTEAKALIFMVSDGTKENQAHILVESDPEYQKKIIAGWKQFDEDLANYVPEEKVPEAVGRTPENLPALHIEVTGEVTASNLAQYKEHAI